MSGKKKYTTIQLSKPAKQSIDQKKRRDESYEDYLRRRRIL